jgi:hypothetical protein
MNSSNVRQISKFVPQDTLRHVIVDYEHTNIIHYEADCHLESFSMAAKRSTEEVGRPDEADGIAGRFWRVNG